MTAQSLSAYGVPFENIKHMKAVLAFHGIDFAARDFPQKIKHLEDVFTW